MEGLIKRLEEEAAEQAGEDSNRQEEARAAGHPALTVGCQAAAGNDAVQVRVELERLVSVWPQVWSRAMKTDLGTEVTRVASDGVKRCGCTAEQNVIDNTLVLQGNRGDRFGHGEDDVKVGHREQIGLVRFQPGRARQRLALAAVPIAARVVRDADVTAGVALFGMTA
jgi:hypothetical protein